MKGEIFWIEYQSLIDSGILAPKTVTRTSSVGVVVSPDFLVNRRISETIKLFDSMTSSSISEGFRRGCFLIGIVWWYSPVGWLGRR